MLYQSTPPLLYFLNQV